MVLDVGCAATGRTARLLRDLGHRVTSIEINGAAVAEFASHGDAADIRLATADMLQLPFADRSFALVLVGFHGIDYLPSRNDRVRAAAEFRRVLKQEGRLVFNTFNPVGYTVNPLLQRTRRLQFRWLRYLATGGSFRSSFVDVNGLRLQQGPLRQVRQDMRRGGSFELRSGTDASGRAQSVRRLEWMAAEPYLIFGP